MQRIIGREKELAALRALWTSEKSEFVAVHGRRRVGKTFLIRTAFEEAFAFAFRTETMTRKTIFLTMVTTFGVQVNMHSVGLVQNDVRMGALFEG